MRRERVSDDIYVFTSDLYAQVTASAVVTRGGIVIVDTLPFRSETVEMIDYLNSLGQGPIKYLVNTHWHGDHTNGNCLFDESVELVCHRNCQQAMMQYSEAELAASKEATPLLEGIKVKIPEVVFEEGKMVIHVGNKSIELILSPGHTFDSTMAYVREDKVLIAADTVMPVPYFVWGDRHVFRQSLEALKTYNLESIVQGHGEVLLRGEIPGAIDSNIEYLNIIEKKVQEVVNKGKSRQELNELTIDHCGKSRIPLNGLVQDLHLANIQYLYDEFVSVRDGVETEEDGADEVEHVPDTVVEEAGMDMIESIKEGETPS
ncbi:MBL fold metallo-hydrolase [Anaerolineales bacterium HSG6]|nr:MBL fold metallo-hydrolase [Anaerolineales bacterium HSG6]